MKDKHTIERVALLHPKFRPLVEQAINDIEAGENIILRVVQGFRTFAEQQALYDQGRNGHPGPIVTYSPPGSSYHNFACAVDVARLIDNGQKLDWEYPYKILVPYFAKYGCTWGGLFKHPDTDHFENKFGLTWQQMLVMYEKKQFIPGTQYIQI